MQLHVQLRNWHIDLFFSLADSSSPSLSAGSRPRSRQWQYLSTFPWTRSLFIRLLRIDDDAALLPVLWVVLGDYESLDSMLRPLYSRDWTVLEKTGAMHALFHFKDDQAELKPMIGVPPSWNKSAAVRSKGRDGGGSRKGTRARYTWPTVQHTRLPRRSMAFFFLLTVRLGYQSYCSLFLNS